MRCDKCALRDAVQGSPMCRRCYERAFGGPPEIVQGNRSDWKPNNTPSAFRPKAEPITDPDEYLKKRSDLPPKLVNR